MGVLVGMSALEDGGPLNVGLIESIMKVNYAPQR